MSKQNKDLLDPSEIGVTKRPKTKEVVTKGVPMNAGWGILWLTVCASVVYANYRVFFGVNELIPRLMLIPSTLAVLAFLLYKSWK